MEEHIHTYTDSVISPEGIRYRVHAYGSRNELGTWYGWLVFEPEGRGTRLRTDRETTQPERDDLVYWASGLEGIYLEGALARAFPI
jgi:hypothetical protein